MIQGEPPDTLAPELDRLQTALRLADAAIAHCDRDLVLRWANDAYARLFGRAADELPGTALAALLGVWLDGLADLVLEAVPVLISAVLAWGFGHTLATD